MVAPIAAAVFVTPAVEWGRVAPLAADVDGEGGETLLVLLAVVVLPAFGARFDAGLEVVVRRLQTLLAYVTILERGIMVEYEFDFNHFVQISDRPKAPFAGLSAGVSYKIFGRN